MTTPASATAKKIAFIGDGFSNILWPTTALPVICSIAKVPIDKWWKYFVPFFGWLLLAQAIFMAIAVAINLQ